MTNANVTVTAADTATAMDEIWDRLGPDAMIVSTKKTRQNRHGPPPRQPQTGQSRHGPTQLDLALFTNQSGAKRHARVNMPRQAGPKPAT